MVRVGFWQGLEVKPEASMTKRFLMSWVCWNWLRTDFFGVGAHAGDARFVNGPSRSGGVGVGADVSCSGGFEHFAGGVAHVLDHGAFVFAVGHVDFEDGNSVDVFDGGVELNEILPAREDFAEAGDFEVLRGSRRAFL